MPTHIDLPGLLRREQIASALINAVLSLAFFTLVFGLAARPLDMGAPDRFALDFLPQGLMVSLMASLVPTLLARAKLRKTGLAPTGIARIVGTGVAIGIASAVVLAALCLLGPMTQVPSHPALAFKIVYGAGLGLGCTRLALTALFARTQKEPLS